GVVQHAGPAAVPHLAMAAVAIRDEAIRPRLGLQHIGEVLRAHGRFLHLHVVGADNGRHDLPREFGLGRVVDGGWVIPYEFEFAGSLMRRADVFGDLLHAPFDQVQHFQREGAHGALQLAAVGHDIGGLPAMDHRYRNDPRVDRLLVAADDGLERLHHLAGDGHWIDAVVRQGRMASLAADSDLEFVARSHDRPRTHREFPDRIAGPVVHAEYGFHRELLEEAVLDHLARAAAAFFRRLEDEVDRAVEVAVPGEMLGCREQHGYMPVVAAGVHLALVPAGVAEGVELLHRQRIHVGAQANRARTGAVPHDADDPRRTQAAVDRDTPFRELLGHYIGGAHFFETQFGMGMDVAPDCGDGRRLGHHRVEDVHVDLMFTWEPSSLAVAQHLCSRPAP